MKKKFISILLSLAISMQCLSFTVNAENNTNISADRVIQLEQADYFDDLITIELVEGEAVQLDFQLDPEIYDLEDIRSYEENRSPIVSYDGKLIGCNSGKYSISVYVRNTDTYREKKFILDVNVLPNENISAENRAELDRINNFGLYDYRRRKLELLGVIDENAPRLTLDKIQEFIDNSEDFYEIIKQVNKYVGYPDDVSGSGMIKYYYWSDPKGNESISISSDNEYIGYVKTADDGMVIGSQLLYPEKSEFAEDGKSKNVQYIDYNQIKPEGYGTLNLKFIDKSTGEAFTETNGTFMLTAKPIEGGTEEEVKSWNITDGSTMILEELSKDFVYTLVYNDEYHTDEQDRLYKYEIARDNLKEVYAFGFDDEINSTVYLKKHYSTDPQRVIMGDVNSDGVFGIADVTTLQKWLLGDSFYGGDIKLNNWRAADLCNDGRLDVFDLCLMKKKLLNSEPIEVPTLEEISKMSNEEATELFSKYTFQDIESIWGKFTIYFSGLYGGGWEIGGKSIDISFDYYTQKLDRVTIYPTPTEDDYIRSFIKRKIDTSEQTVERFISTIYSTEQYDLKNRVTSITVYGVDGGIMTSGELRKGVAKSVVVCYDEDKRLEFDVVY